MQTLHPTHTTLPVPMLLFTETMPTPPPPPCGLTMTG